MFVNYIMRSNIGISICKSSCWKRYPIVISCNENVYSAKNSILRLSSSVSLEKIHHFRPVLNFACNVHTIKGWKSIAYTGQKKDENSIENKFSGSCEEGTNAVPHLVLIDQLKKCHTVSEQIETFCSSITLTEDEIERRKQFCSSLAEVFALYFTKFKVHLFGSSCNGLGFRGCDVDVCIQTVFDGKSCDKNIKQVPTLESVSQGVISSEALAHLTPVSLLRFVRRILREHCPNVDEHIFLIKSRCPILRFYDSQYDVFCDFSCENQPSLRNTKLMRLICNVDERFAALAKLVRYWGKHGGFVGDIDLFNSYAFSVLMLHFLQQTNPPVLPPLSEIIEKSDYLKHGDIRDETLLYEDLKKFEPSKNSQTVEELLREYFFYFVKFDYSNMMMPLTSSVIPKTSFTPNNNNNDDDSDNFEFSTITVQDPFRPNFNVTGGALYRCCKKFLNGLILACRAYQDDTLWDPKTEMWGICSLFHKPMSENEIITAWQQNYTTTLKLPLKSDFSVVKDILQEGLLFEVTEMIHYSTDKNSEPSTKLHCNVYHNTWVGRDLVSRQCPELKKNPLEIENWISKEILRSKCESRKTAVLFRFSYECCKHSNNNEFSVILSFNEPKSSHIAAIFLKEFIPSVYNKLVS